MNGLCTAIISDLHLTDSEPARNQPKSRHPLWKKFKTKDFFIDETLVSFLKHIQDKAQNRKIELILNGDIFDFDSVMSLPDNPIYKITWLEKKRGLFPKQERSVFKIKTIINEHYKFFAALSEFIQNGNHLVIIPGNHDVELHFPDVQSEIIKALNLSEDQLKSIRFVDWFYVSNQDTLVEHGHQQDPYCMCENPINPFLLDYNELTIRLPFGNVACRYMMNGLGLFNPHVEKNYIMSVQGYLKFFFKYLVKAQPLIIWTWLWGAVATLWHVTLERFAEPYRGPISLEKKTIESANKSQTSPAVVRELQELFALPATQNPILIMKELWLDRLFLILFGFVVLGLAANFIQSIISFSFYWVFLVFALLVPFFLFYARSVTSLVSQYKEPSEALLVKQSELVGVRRIVYGHTHIARHEFYGIVEHLNSGSWSPAFTNVECTESIEKNTFVWISPQDKNNSNVRKAELLQFSFKKEDDL